MSGHLFFLSENLLVISLTALLFAVLGWWLRGRKAKPGTASRQPDTTAERNRQRAADERLKKAEADAAASAAELTALQKISAPRTELAAAQAALAAEKERTESLSTQLKKSREQQQAVESRKTDSSKAQQNRVFDLENQLGKAREEAARAVQATADAQADLAKVRSAGSSSTKEIKDLQNQVLGLRTTTQQATKAADEARATHEAAASELTAAREQIVQIERDLAAAQARARIVDKNGPASPATSVVRGISEEQFAAVRSALANAQRDRDAAQSKCDTAVEDLEAAQAELKQLKARFAPEAAEVEASLALGDSAAQ